VVAWSYNDLKGYDPEIIQHTIELTDESKHVRQNQRLINLKIKSLMAQELGKLNQSHIVFPIKHSTWVSNLVLVQKKNGDILLCVDLWDLNKESLKDHYPLPSMESILQTVVGFKMFSLLDGFSDYNQIIIRKQDQHKTTFTTKWGFFSYSKIPFGLSNVEATFQ
jgi:hypothetical protein